ncbi:hypothetical protein DOTSEDRAFT_23761 [Dothistroma septosporum NZE10]|uniref:Uncharacterized protein n=1 Tax=Dothistroma septosporum (strain NZE10 / CBS 128990) TaxID=675120 RepID=N1PS64_DOTSN|nr:hypothetical protein DOTSEDRAFT_23761 [Dothistroma septosporum NZE10]
MFASNIEQSIVNLICFYEAFGHVKAQDVKESWIQLLLCLNIFDYRGLPLCRFWANDDCVNKEHAQMRWVHDGQIRCCHHLTDRKHLIHAFRNFYVDGSDPLIERQGDSALLEAIITFVTHACCVEHKSSKIRMQILAEELLPVVKKWRRYYVFCEPSDPAFVEEVMEVELVGRVSGIFSRRLRKRKKNQRSRSASPSSDEDSPAALLELRRPLRPMSSAHDILATARRNVSNASDWSVTQRGRSRKAHFQALLKSTGLGYGGSATTKARTPATGRPLSTILAGGSHDSMTDRVSTSIRID